MLRDVIGLYYFDGNYNCAEALLHAANEYYQLGLGEREMKLVSGYGAGIQTESVCGALLAAVSVLSLKYVETKAHESEEIKPLTQELIRRFEEELAHSILCERIRPVYFQPEKRCFRTVEAACDVLEAVIRDRESGDC
ncbi:MAG: C-GCAxxG-C-C family protein [Parasporobacterium sp.]|nr:C-GCAxxG-C-C family protein [Parasporobacterium sp.]